MPCWHQITTSKNSISFPVALAIAELPDTIHGSTPTPSCRVIVPALTGKAPGNGIFRHYPERTDRFFPLSDISRFSSDYKAASSEKRHFNQIGYDRIVSSAYDIHGHFLYDKRLTE